MDNREQRFLLSEDDQKALLDELCIGLGFCSLGDHCLQQLRKTPLTVDEFTAAVIEGEGGGEHSRKAIRQLVASYYDAATNHGLWWLKFPENSPDDPSRT
ncbi:hypothetical protein NA78x_006068 [Anatilimnocola sp. NA78]|uniref:hypothetical protein n=1 Tax=Anatilimnocola sp. NA78 TaxID=3415683 RepID=UPI003CE4FCED